MDFWTNLQKRRDQFTALSAAHKALVEQAESFKLPDGSTIVDPTTAWGYVRQAFEEYERALQKYALVQGQIAAALKDGSYRAFARLTVACSKCGPLTDADPSCRCHTWTHMGGDGDLWNPLKHVESAAHVSFWEKRLGVQSPSRWIHHNEAEMPGCFTVGPIPIFIGLSGEETRAFCLKVDNFHREILSSLKENILSVWPEWPEPDKYAPHTRFADKKRKIDYYRSGIFSVVRIGIGAESHHILTVKELEPLLPLVRKVVYEAYLKSQVVSLPAWIGDSTLPTNPKTQDPNDVGFANHKKGGKTYKPLTAKLLDIQAFVCAGVPKLRLLFGVVSGVDIDNNDLRGRTFIAERAVESYGTAAELAEMGLVTAKPDNTKDLAASMQAIASQTFDHTEKAKLIARVPLLAIGIELDSFAGRTLRRVDFIGRGGK